MDMEKIIFQSYTTVLPLSNFQYLDENYRPLYLSVAEGEEPSLSVTTTVMIINPKTTRMEEAKTYMEYYVTHLPKDEGAITFFQGTPEPVESPYYARQKKETEKQIANAKERLYEKLRMPLWVLDIIITVLVIAFIVVVLIGRGKAA